MRLKRDFFERPTLSVARDLLGKILVVKDGKKIIKGRIVEVESYTNDEDDAAHFHKGLTDRTRVMDQAGGHIYIYSIYGMYLCLNIVAEKKGVHGGNLIRAIEPIEGLDLMYKNRYKKDFDQASKKELLNLTNGPAKLVMSYGITKDFYGKDLVYDKNIWLEDGPRISDEDLVRTTRINIDYAEKGKDYLFRFYIKNNPYVSKK